MLRTDRADRTGGTGDRPPLTATVGRDAVCAGASAEPETLNEFGLRRVLVVLCVTEIVSWGVLYYAFPVLAPSIAADTGWSIAEVTAAFSTGLVVSALLGIPAGRWLDRAGPRPVMTLGSVLAGPGRGGYRDRPDAAPGSSPPGSWPASPWPAPSTRPRSPR